MQQKLANIWNLGIKEFRSLYRDPLMLVLIIWAFSGAIYTAASAQPETLNAAPIAIADEDHSQLSARIAAAFYPPYFHAPDAVSLAGLDRGLDSGRYTFALDIPPNFERDVLAARAPTLQLNVDATRLSQAFLGSGYIQSIIDGEVREFAQGYRAGVTLPVEIEPRLAFNPTGSNAWFGAVMELINNVTMLSIILTGAALIREREHGTIEHLLVMPITPLEIMLAKVWSMGVIVLLATALSLQVVIRQWLAVPIAGSAALFLAGAALHLFATTSMGIFLGTVSRSMPQLGLLMILILMPLEILSGGMTPRESMPSIVADIMLAAPTTHFVAFAQAILYRGAGFDVVWPRFLAILGIGTVFFSASLMRFRATIVRMQT